MTNDIKLHYSRTEPPCGRDCPDRSPGCHNTETCEKWAEFVRAKEAANAIASKAKNAERDYAGHAIASQEKAKRRNGRK